VILASTLPLGPLAVSMRLALGAPRGQTFLSVHESGGVIWLNKERYEDLARFLAEREIASGKMTSAAATAEATKVIELAAQEGYRAEPIATKLGPVPQVEGLPARARNWGRALGDESARILEEHGTLPDPSALTGSTEVVEDGVETVETTSVEPARRAPDDKPVPPAPESATK
jgi:hypothetical protein